MTNISGFFATMLSIIAEFLGSDPIIYIFALVCLIILVQIFRRIMSL